MNITIKPINGVCRCAKCGAALDGDRDHTCGVTYEQLVGDLLQARMERDTYGESVKMLSEDAKRMRERIVELEKQNETARQQVQTLRTLRTAVKEWHKRYRPLINGVLVFDDEDGVQPLELWGQIGDALAATEPPQDE